MSRQVCLVLRNTEDAKMDTQFTTHIAIGEDSFQVGKEAAQGALHKMSDHPDIHLVVLFSSIKFNYAEVAAGVKSVVGEVPIIGCTCAGQFSDQDNQKDGIACALISSDNYKFFTGMGKELKADSIGAVKEAIRNFPEEIEGYPYHSAILFIDALTGKGEEAVLAASSLLGPMVKFAGGAAGDNLKFVETKVFHDEEAVSDAITICLIASSSPVIISVKHGHKPISPPLRITKATGNILYEVEGRPALDVWKDYIREPLKEKGVDIDHVQSVELSKILANYEAGLFTGSEYKIRFPSSANPDGSLNFVSEMVQGTVLKIMSSEEQDQIDAAQRAAEEAIKHSRGRPLAGALIFDCGCRALILKENFYKAIDAYKSVLGECPFIGGETYGEIAMEMGLLSGFHNTTSVIMLFPA